MPQRFQCLHRSRRFPFLVVASVMIVSLPMIAGGCVAMNIPSVRYDDPGDRGGLLGPHKQTDPEVIAAIASGNCFVDGSGSCLDCVGEGEDFAGGHSEKPPEVPWPRFHPLPTRPVFSAAR